MQLSATLPARFRQVVHQVGRAVIDGVLPPRCLACGTNVDELGALCGQCWATMTFFAPPWCAACGLPFPHPMGEGAVCADCARGRANWDLARAVMRYDKHSRRLVLALKYDRTDVANALGGWRRGSGGEILDGADLIVRVPLHWPRLLSRRYNQAGLLAHAIHAAGGPPVAPDWLVRRRRTPSQGRLGPAGGARNPPRGPARRPGASGGGEGLVGLADGQAHGAPGEGMPLVA